MERADFFKLRDITARIPVPFRMGGVTSATVSLSLHNWYRWVNSDFPIYDPEVSNGTGGEPAAQKVRATGGGTIPPPRTFTASVRLVF